MELSSEPAASQLSAGYMPREPRPSGFARASKSKPVVISLGGGQIASTPSQVEASNHALDAAMTRSNVRQNHQHTIHSHHTLDVLQSRVATRALKQFASESKRMDSTTTAADSVFVQRSGTVLLEPIDAGDDARGRPGPSKSHALRRRQRFRAVATTAATATAVARARKESLAAFPSGPGPAGSRSPSGSPRGSPGGSPSPSRRGTSTSTRRPTSARSHRRPQIPLGRGGVHLQVDDEIDVDRMEMHAAAMGRIASGIVLSRDRAGSSAQPRALPRKSRAGSRGWGGARGVKTWAKFTPGTQYRNDLTQSAAAGGEREGMLGVGLNEMTFPPPRVSGMWSARRPSGARASTLRSRRRTTAANAAAQNSQRAKGNQVAPSGSPAAAASALDIEELENTVDIDQMNQLLNQFSIQSQRAVPPDMNSTASATAATRTGSAATAATASTTRWHSSTMSVLAAAFSFQQPPPKSKLEGQEFASSPGGSRIMPLKDDAGNIVDAAAWNHDASAEMSNTPAGQRARRMQIRFNLRREAGVLHAIWSALSKAWRYCARGLGCMRSGGAIANAGSTKLFRSMIKAVGAHFGGGIAAFFRFVRYIFWINFAMFALELVFVVVPGFVAWPAIQRRPLVASNLTCSSGDDPGARERPFIPADRTLHSVSVADMEAHWQAVDVTPFEVMGKEFALKNYLDGKGVMGYSPIFFGGYNAVLGTDSASYVYRVDVAYILVYMVCSLGLLFSVMHRAFRKTSASGSAIFNASPQHPYSTGIFTAWDFSLKSEAAVKSLQLSIFSAGANAIDDIALQREKEANAKNKPSNLGADKAAVKELQRVAEHERQEKLVATKNAVDEMHAALHANANTNGTVKSLKQVAASSQMLKRFERLEEQLELLVQQDESIAQGRRDRASLLLRRLVGWFLWLVILGATFTGVSYLIAEFLRLQSLAKEGLHTLSIVDEYMLAGVLALVNGSLPTMFNVIAYFENYENEQTKAGELNNPDSHRLAS